MKKIGGHASREELNKLAAALECMPLALTQAAAYIKRRGGRISVRQYLKKVYNGDQLSMELLDFNKADLRRDRRAKNSISSAWQISFTHILETRRTAVELEAVPGREHPVSLGTKR